MSEEVTVLVAVIVVFVLLLYVAIYKYLNSRWSK